MQLSRDDLKRAYRSMFTIRTFEERVTKEFAQGNIPGFAHVYIGQEASGVGVCFDLTSEDYIGSTHRGHGHCIAKGCDVQGMMLEIMGKQGGLCGGKGGSMHIADFSVGMLGANGVVGANIVIAAGAAHAIKLKREDRIVCCIFGDGAINRGPFLEGLNWAAVFKLPVLFVCEDNGFAATTRTASMTAGAGPAARARAIGLPAEEVDGNFLPDIDAAARAMIASVRAGGGPRFLHAKTYRLTGHTGVDAAAYRPAAELEARQQEEPIGRTAELLRAAGETDLDADQRAAEAEMNSAYAAALAAPFPDPEEAFSDVQDIGSPACA